MLGWKAVEKSIGSGISLEEAQAIMIEKGFDVYVSNPGHIIFKRSGTQWTFSMKKIPVEVAIAKSESGLFIQARYDAFVLFDTGDLEKFINELVAHFMTPA